MSSCTRSSSRCRVASVSAASGRAETAPHRRGAPRPAWVSTVSRRNRLGGNRSTAPRTTPTVSWVSTSPSTKRRSSEIGPLDREGMDDVAERILMGLQPAVGGYVDAPIHHILAVMVARRQPQRLDHAGGGSVVAIDALVRDADAHGSFPKGQRASTPLAAYNKYWELTAAPSALLSETNSLMNSCSPDWKISSIRLFCRRVRTARAWRWASPCRP